MNEKVLIQEYSATDAVIEQLRSKYLGVKYAVDTSEGMQLAVAARAEVRRWRTGLEKTRVEIKAPALQRCQQIDSEAKRITTALLAIETPIDAQIKAEEGKEEAARLAKLNEALAKAKAYDELQEANRKAAEQAALQAQRDEIAKQRAALEAAAAEQRKAEAAAAAARAEADRVAAAERAAAQKKLDEERAAIAAQVAAQRAADAASRAAREEQLIAGASLVEAAKMAHSAMVKHGLIDLFETRALAAAIKRVEDGAK